MSLNSRQVYFDMDCVDEDMLESFIADLGLRRTHHVNDPSCFICRHYCRKRHTLNSIEQQIIYRFENRIQSQVLLPRHIVCSLPLKKRK